MEKTMFISKSTLFMAVVAFIVGVQPVMAQQIGGRNGYTFPPRNASMAAQMQLQQRQIEALQRGGAAAGSSAGGLGSLNQFVNTYSTNYSSSSTSIGNMNTVTQVLSDGSTGTVGQSTDQQSTGDQGSQADTNATIDNSVTSSDATTESTDTSTETSADSSSAQSVEATTNAQTTQSAN
jgi:hypothetical protein